MDYITLEGIIAETTSKQSIQHLPKKFDESTKEAVYRRMRLRGPDYSQEIYNEAKERIKELQTKHAQIITFGTGLGSFFGMISFYDQFGPGSILVGALGGSVLGWFFGVSTDQIHLEELCQKIENEVLPTEEVGCKKSVYKQENNYISREDIYTYQNQEYTIKTYVRNNTPTRMEIKKGEEVYSCELVNLDKDGTAHFTSPIQIEMTQEFRNYVWHLKKAGVKFMTQKL